ncbi:MAG TPA: DNA polymerase I, partial [Gammaproteobacteria bacterium]|nr:DNA polymerase I [Gammaproteobacteria bacterium]
PGIDGVGPKTAVKWLQQFGDLETLKARAAEVSGKIGDRLRAALGTLDLSKQLATIRCDVELPLKPADLALRPQDSPRLAALFERLEFTRLLRRVREEPVAQAATPPPPAAPVAERPPARYETIVTQDELERWCERIAAAQRVALDTETTNQAYMRAELVGISLAVTPGEAAYIPLGHRYPGAPDQLDRDAVLERLKPWLESEAPKVGHHLKYDAHIFANHGIALRGIEHDTMLESYVLNSTATRHDLDSVATFYLGPRTVKYEDVVGKGAKQITFDQVDLDAATRYSAEDADLALQLHQTLWPKLAAEPALTRVYKEIECPLVRVLEDMEYAGVMVDARLLREQSQELAEKMAATEKTAYSAAGGPFNLGSPKQLQEVLYDRLHLPVLGKTQKGQPSTSEDVLEQLAEEHELPKLILEYRSLTKLKSTYTDRLPVDIDPRTKRIHTSYHQAVAATGRLSSSDPNLQNIPIRTAEGRRIRQAFIAAPGFKLLAADYSQIELRIMAHLSGDEGLLAAFASDQDVHRATAAEVFGAPLEAVTVDQRRSAKTINFGLIYGMSAFGLAKQLGIERGQAQAYVDRYFERYPGVRRYMDETRASARRTGYVSTVFGRRLYLPDINARNPQVRQYAERSAINAPMQGTAADIIKRAMVGVARWLASHEPQARLIMQVHDELVVEVPEHRGAEIGAGVAQIMEAAADLRVPLRVDRGLGANWDEAH